MRSVVLSIGENGVTARSDNRILVEAEGGGGGEGGGRRNICGVGNDQL